MHDFNLLDLLSTKVHLLDHEHVSPVKVGFWENGGTLHHHSSQFFHHHQIGDFHSASDLTDLSLPTSDLRVIDIEI